MRGTHPVEEVVVAGARGREFEAGVPLIPEVHVLVTYLEHRTALHGGGRSGRRRVPVLAGNDAARGAQGCAVQ